MSEKPVLESLAVIALSLLFLVCAAPAAAQDDDDFDIAGPYIASLDLGALGEPRIEALGVYLDENGGVLFISEHEADKESAGVGVWKLLRGGRISIGVLSFRYGPDEETSICGLVGVMSPPGNCFLKVGGVVHRAKRGQRLVGQLFLTIETVDGTGAPVTIADPLPLDMRKLRLGDFPGAPRR